MLYASPFYNVLTSTVTSFTYVHLPCLSELSLSTARMH